MKKIHLQFLLVHYHCLHIINHFTNIIAPPNIKVKRQHVHNNYDGDVLNRVEECERGWQESCGPRDPSEPDSEIITSAAFPSLKAAR